MSTIVISDVNETVVIEDAPDSSTSIGGGSADVAAETAARIAADALKIPLTQKGSANGVATLDSAGLVAASELPPLTLTLGATFAANSEAEMLALPAVSGDACIRTDLDPDGFFVLVTLPPSSLSNWQQILSPGTVLSVDGRTGTVSLSDRYDSIGAYNRSPVRFGKAGTVAVVPGKSVEPVTDVETISSVMAYCATAPTGADMVLQLMKNGVAVVSLTIVDGTNGVTVNASVDCVPGDVLTLDVVQVGSTVAGWDLTVKVLFV